MEALKIEIDDTLNDQSSSSTKSPKFQELSFKLQTSNKPDKIVSPVIPQTSPYINLGFFCIFALECLCFLEDLNSGVFCASIVLDGLNEVLNIDLAAEKVQSAQKQKMIIVYNALNKIGLKIKIF
jgi:hypothetical protein